MSISEPQVLIIELGGQLTQNIGRVLRESAKVRSAILSPEKAELWLRQNTPKGIILSGSGKSVNDPEAPAPPEIIFSLKRDGRPVPILGLCYGMQYLAKYFGGEVSKGARQYGDSHIEVVGRPTPLFYGCPRKQKVWMSHGDSVTIVGRGFISVAFSPGCVSAMTNEDQKLYAVQFHPEATQTKYGATILSNFVEFIAQCKEDWEPSSLVESIQIEVLNQIGDGKVVLPWSGGVDSSALAVILSRALGERLLYFTIDGNQLREGELDEIRKTAEFIGGNFKLIQAHEDFAEVMASSAHGPTKRKNFQVPYGNILIAQATEFGATHVPQGTLAPDLIESGKTGGEQIVLHHNDLELPGFTMLHPMRHLFKYEVRELAKKVGLPEYVYNRQPFPGPGLYLRVIGGLATRENIAVVRWADARATEITKHHGIYEKISQLVVGYDLTPTSGVKGDEPYSGGSAIVRPFVTHDFMTGEGMYLPEPVVRELSRELPKHPQICRVWFDYTPKPPGRTELQ